jgi:hypothetical protein
MPAGTCFNYPADVPGVRNPGAARPGQRTMPNTICFSYPDGVPRGMPIGGCFSYSSDIPPGDGAEPDLGDPCAMPFSCFCY